MNSEISKLIVKVLSGEASLEDKQALIVWLGQDQENMKVLRQTESVWTAIDIISAKEQYNPNEAFERFESVLQKEPGRENRSNLKRTLDIVLRIAAMIVILMGISYMLFRPDRNAFTSDNQLCEVVAPAGSKAQVVLPDGTRVWLNADSRINYRKDFNGSSREIYLEGEGYFEVAKNPFKPFVVNTSDIKIKALGTSFNVKSYPGDGTIEATLIEGKVVLEQKSADKKANRILALKPNQQAIFYKQGTVVPEHEEAGIVRDHKESIKALKARKSNLLLSEKVNTELATAWKNNYLYFDNELFRNITVKLERRFGITIQFMDDKIGQYRFSGKFDDVILEQVLAALQYASPFEYSIEDKSIIIYNKSQKPVPGR